MVPSAECHTCSNNGTGIACPNNWQVVFGGDDPILESSWTFHPTVGKYYYHAFGWFQPDVNTRNKAVVDELNSVLDYWLQRVCSFLTQI